jgi:hypothetical protein
MQETMTNITKESAEVHLMRKGLDAGLAKVALVCEETKIKFFFMCCLLESLLLLLLYY